MSKNNNKTGRVNHTAALDNHSALEIMVFKRANKQKDQYPLPG